MRRYRVLLPLLVHTEDAAYAQGEEFDRDFTVDEEAEALDSGLLELLPQRYKVVGESTVHGADPGQEFEAALPLGNEAQLMAGGHIALVEPAKPVKKPTRQKKE